MPTSKQRHHCQARRPSETVAPYGGLEPMVGGPEPTDRRRGTGLGKREEGGGSAKQPKRVIDAMWKKR